LDGEPTRDGEPIQAIKPIRVIQHELVRRSPPQPISMNMFDDLNYDLQSSHNSRSKDVKNQHSNNHLRMDLMPKVPTSSSIAIDVGFMCRQTKYK